MNESAAGAALELRRLSKNFAGVKAVDDVSLAVPAGAFVSLLGPSGSGKTTTLNLVAGFLDADAGDILIDGRSVVTVPPHRRNIGMVFQSYALFPHMNVADNVEYPLRMRTDLRGARARERVAEMLALIQLAPLAQRYPRQLSGGQQQRVAMARALVSRPRLMLMDEPLGALDRKLREQLQSEIKRIHRSVGTTFVYVTHDQAEALTLSDTVVVMHQGRIAQIGKPQELYDAPATAFVADFLGESNLLAARLADGDAVTLADGQLVRLAAGTARPAAPDGHVALLLRPEDVTIAVDGVTPPDCETLAGTVAEVSYHGDAYRVAVAAAGETLKVKVPRGAELRLAPGMPVRLAWRRAAARLLPPREAGAA